jgi:hypothetical protein
MKTALVLLILFACNLARADFPVHFIKATCVPEMDYFEISVSDANNPSHLYSLDEKTGRTYLKESVAASLRKKGIVIQLEPGQLSCSLEGMKIDVENEPYPTSERDLFPGSRVSITINGHAYAKAVNLFTSRSGPPFLTKVLVNGNGFGNEHGYVYYTAKPSEDGLDFWVYQAFPSKSTVTNKTLGAFDGKQTTLYPQDDGSVRE